MNWKTYSMASLLVVALGCGANNGGVGDPAAMGSGDTAVAKQAAAESIAAVRRSAGAVRVRTRDVCADRGWYGDGVCDSFCAALDSDCSVRRPQPDAIVCAQFIEAADGICGRDAQDPCRFQDPDCAVSIPPTRPDPEQRVACAAISENSDGTCGRDRSDPCSFQDPDCSQETRSRRGREPVDQPPSQSSDAGCAGRVDGGGVVPPPPVTREPVCRAILEASDGKCTRLANDPCWSQDPDCKKPTEPVLCLAYVESPDGKCSRMADDGCASQDPDCVNPVPAPVPPPVPPPPVTREPVCRAILEASDGKCTRLANDPCWSQDPDCKKATEPVPCLAYIESSDGKCSRMADDACASQDPDCV